MEMVGPIHLAFARLAIIDLTATGSQPMVSTDGRYITMLNGEIYNHRELRQQLSTAGYRFSGTSDAEVIPHGFSEWGPALFARLRGMFAVVVCDTVANEVWLSRDHFGIKPMYFASVGEEFVFSSSARAVTLHPSVGCDLRDSAIGEFLRFRYVASGDSMFARVETLAPGTHVHWSNGRLTTTRFWRPAEYAAGEQVDSSDWVQRFDDALSASVNAQLMSDVPLGVLLSGGIDSGAVLHHAARCGNEGLLAFTYQMPAHHDETRDARAIADESSVCHRVVGASREPFADSFMKALRAMDTPVGDAIIVPTFHLLEAVSHERKVVLTGEGADELLGGYAHVGPLLKLGRAARLGMPLGVAASLVGLMPRPLLDLFFPYETALGRGGKRKLQSLVQSASTPSLALDAATSVISRDELPSIANLAPNSDGFSIMSLTMPALIDWGYSAWLPNQILNKMDQLSMAHGVEARVPYVDPVVYDVVRMMPRELLVNSRENKVVLRESLRRASCAWAERPKRAFFVPNDAEHARNLSSAARDWLGEEMCSKHGVLKSAAVRDKVAEMQQGDFLAAKQVATMCALHMWLDQDFAA
jgi:asparagine synthase (glutamine-hydrolysing)